MKRTLRKYNKALTMKSINKKTIKLRDSERRHLNFKMNHKKYKGGTESKTKTKTHKKKGKVKPILNIVETFEEDFEEAYKDFNKLTAPFGLPSTDPLKFIEEKIDDNNLRDLKVPAEEIHKMEPEKTRLNEKFIDLMEKLSSIMLKQGEPFRARAYQKAQETIMTFNGDINSPAQLKGLPGIGDTIMEKLNEYVKTGTLKILEREKANPINILGEVYGIGPKKAKELVDSGITTIEMLREKQDQVLNDTQRTGLKYYEDILKRIPRAEIDEYDKIFKNVFSKAAGIGSEAKFEIVGSYRRGAQNSGDIDVIITSKTGEVFRKFVDELIKEKVILEVLSRGDTKCLVIAKLPGGETARRVDFLYTSPKEYPFSVLYFTGSKIFNTVMRGRALSLGYSLNEHGMSKMQEKKKGEKAVKGELVSHTFNTEKDIFDFLGMVYKSPVERVDGRALILKDSIDKINVEPVAVVAEVAAEVKKHKVLKKKVKLVIQEDQTGEESFSQQVNLAKENPAALDLVQQFKKNGIHVLDSLTEPQLSSMIEEANSAYHLNKTPIMTDNEYDILKEYLENKFPDSVILTEVGAPIIEKNKVALPYEMASMNKIKPDTGALSIWKKKFLGPYVLSCKLDGVSGLYSFKDGVAKLYTRGNGRVGQDVSHLIPYLKFPKMSGGETAVRGEFIIPKKVFQDKYSSNFANPRNLVAGIVNRQTLDDKVKDLHFVSYEVIAPELKPSEQMKLLMDRGFETVLNRTVMTGDLTNELLSEVLVKWRTDYLYEIDGIIVTDDKVYGRKSGNPEHSFAFKMVLSNQIAEVKVVDVLWTPSKDGYLKPRVQIEPVQLGGVKIEYATGFNAAFIEQNKIGIGALIQIIRSGDVIPHIRSVTTAAENAKMPDVPYKWNDTHVDIMLEDISSDATVREKNLTGFFRGIGVDGLSSGNISRIVNAGFDTVPKVIHMKKDDFLKVEGFKDKLATKIYEGIREKLTSATLISLISASNIFGRGFSDKRVELILESYPTVLTSSESASEKIKKISAIKGMATKTAEAFVENIPAFIKFLEECGLSSKLGDIGSIATTVVDTSHPLYKKSVVMTGIRDAKVAEALKAVGANLGSSVSKNTVAVIAKSVDEDTGKASEARKLGIPILTPNDFMTKYFN